MNVELMSATPDALNLLLRTKNTRLKHDSDPAGWTEEEKEEHLEYMQDTIKSSWEFVDYTFRITGVTRAFTHQLVRTRTGSYAQEAQRVIDAGENGYLNPLPETMDHQRYGDEYFGPREWFDKTAKESLMTYRELINAGIHAQDARGILPTNILTSIIAKFNLRTLHDTAKLRLCTRTQGEYQQVFRAMRQRVLEVHPWTEPFIQVHCVATGTCAFPRYGKADCRYYDPRMNLDMLKLEVKEKFWSDANIHEAAPIAKGGKAS